MFGLLFGLTYRIVTLCSYFLHQLPLYSFRHLFCTEKAVKHGVLEGIYVIFLVGEKFKAFFTLQWVRFGVCSAFVSRYLCLVKGSL